MQAEIELHNFYRVHINPYFANKAKATSTGFYTCMVGKDNPMSKMRGEKSPFYGKKFSEERKEKLRQARKNRVYTEETKRKIGESKKGNINMLGKKHSEESKKLMSEKQKGKIRSEETRKKISEAKKGTIVSENTKLKLKEKRIQTERDIQKEDEPETKLRMSLHKKSLSEKCLIRPPQTPKSVIQSQKINFV